MDNDMGKLHDHLNYNPDYAAELEIWEIHASEGCAWDEAIDRWKDRNLPFTELPKFDWMKEDKSIPF